MGNKRYWNKLSCANKKTPNPHLVYSISIPEHILQRTDWEKDDLIGFQLSKGYSKARFSIELRNLSKEKEPYASLTFLQAEEQHKDFLKKITTRNRGNFSKDLQKILIEQGKNKIKKREKEAEKRSKEAGEKLEELSLVALRDEIERKKETNKERIKQVEKGNERRLKVVKKFLEEELKEKEKMLKKLMKTLRKTTNKPKTLA